MTYLPVSSGAVRQIFEGSKIPEIRKTVPESARPYCVILYEGKQGKDTSLLQRARNQHISRPVELDLQVEKRIRDANLDFSDLRAGIENLENEVGRITVGIIKRQFCETPYEY